MSFKISLQYENISERAYVKTLYELFDENDNSLYIKSVVIMIIHIIQIKYL